RVALRLAASRLSRPGSSRRPGRASPATPGRRPPAGRAAGGPTAPAGGRAAPPVPRRAPTSPASGTVRPVASSWAAVCRGEPPSRVVRPATNPHPSGDRSAPGSGRMAGLVPVGEQRAPRPGGLVVVDKPAGITSHDVVSRVRRLAHTRRVGHAGTLDPMATGVLVLGVERATRLLTYLVGDGKRYQATIRLGQSTITDDAEGEVTGVGDASGLTEAAVRDALTRLTGEIDQVPSAVSAIKVNGRRSYARVRAGEEFQLAARPVTVHRLDLTGLRTPAPTLLDLDVEVECSSG